MMSLGKFVPRVLPRHLAAGARSFQFMTPSQLLVGGGQSKELKGLMTDLGMKRPLLITDPYMHSSGKAQDLLNALAEKGFSNVNVFSETTPEPTTNDVMKALDAFKAGGHDSVIALGGGSPIDISKVVCVLSTNGGGVRQYKVPARIPLAGAPLIAVPTTAGTGSEVTKAAVISCVETQEKMLLMSQHMIPTAAVVDYELTMSCPLRLTADNAIDALTHAIEAYVSVKANPMSDIYAIQAMKTIPQHIRQVYKNPGDEVSREALMLAATQAGLAFSNASVALVHGMSRPLGVHFKVPHGLSNAMLLPVVTKFSVPAAQKRYADCARITGFATEAQSDEEACESLVQGLIQINKDMEVPSPKDFGIDQNKYMDLTTLMAEQALASGSPGNNPRAPSSDEIIELYIAAYRDTQHA
eukprot:gnl/MRDRNA2_/MRDRNA2_111852_c0_seq1.p1 gnl/MRDRNA2_/MRDRNA2_111852_c0~~gnl/MRDRNA2_/MRDRNA2_111852_c0_seq1.p1  ORF type:complete len:413 (+),score=83.90 gnl/MRDRNA2_/MRDRNA2_111852_c0_seq1:83-1321(+)